MYNCTVASSNRTTVQWLFKGVAVPECKYGEFPCLHENQKLVCTISTTEAEGPFLVHSLSLYICGADESNSGQYSCKIQGFDYEIVQQNSVIIEKTIQITLNHSDDHKNDKRSSDDEKDNDINWIIIILVSISAVMMCVLSALLISTLVKVLLKIRSHRSCDMMDGSHEVNLTSPTSSDDGGKRY